MTADRTEAGGRRVAAPGSLALPAACSNADAATTRHAASGRAAFGSAGTADQARVVEEIDGTTRPWSAPVAEIRWSRGGRTDVDRIAPGDEPAACRQFDRPVDRPQSIGFCEGCPIGGHCLELAVIHDDRWGHARTGSGPGPTRRTTRL